jgi:hypothetical protein
MLQRDVLHCSHTCSGIEPEILVYDKSRISNCTLKFAGIVPLTPDRDKSSFVKELHLSQGTSPVTLVPDKSKVSKAMSVSGTGMLPVIPVCDKDNRPKSVDIKEWGIGPDTFENDRSNQLPGETSSGMVPVKLTKERSMILVEVEDLPILVRISEAAPVKFVRDKLSAFIPLPSHSSGKAP